VLFLQNGGFINGLTDPLWDTSWLLPQEGPGAAAIFGRMLHTLVGYSDSPNGAQLIAYATTIVTIVALMRLVDGHGARRRIAAPRAA
jgi:high-affinity iron transporter